MLLPASWSTFVVVNNRVHLSSLWLAFHVISNNNYLIHSLYNNHLSPHCIITFYCSIGSMSTFSSSSNSCPAVPHNNRILCHLFFGKVPFIEQADLWKCKYGTIRKQNIKLGFSNLLSHIKQRHPNYEEVFAIAQQAHEVDSISDSAQVVTGTGGVSGQTTLAYLFDNHSTNVFKWLQWIVIDEHKFLFCEKEWT